MKHGLDVLFRKVKFAIRKYIAANSLGSWQRPQRDIANEIRAAPGLPPASFPIVFRGILTLLAQYRSRRLLFLWRSLLRLNYCYTAMFSSEEHLPTHYVIGYGSFLGRCRQYLFPVYRTFAGGIAFASKYVAVRR
jgi:hypothetical protein